MLKSYYLYLRQRSCWAPCASEPPPPPPPPPPPMAQAPTFMVFFDWIARHSVASLNVIITQAVTRLQVHRQRPCHARPATPGHDRPEQLQYGPRRSPRERGEERDGPPRRPADAHRRAVGKGESQPCCRPVTRYANRRTAALNRDPARQMATAPTAIPPQLDYAPQAERALTRRERRHQPIRRGRLDNALASVQASIAATSVSSTLERFPTNACIRQPPRGY